MKTQDSIENASQIVAIGASAGGLHAFSELISHLPIDTGMGFVVVQHLSPDRESMLSELLGRNTSMPVATAEDGVVVQANCVYVIPPNALMTIEQGRLHLTPCDPTQKIVKTIDIFFQSLAHDQKNKAIAIVLSGSNNDGVSGIQSIRAEGGIVFAQSLETAEFSDMPERAIATGVVDFVMSPTAIAEELVKLKHHPYLSAILTDREAIVSPTTEEDEIVTVFHLLQRQTGVDFANYKQSTFQRRLHRRMALKECLKLSDYVKCLQEQPSEIEALYRDILIIVTSFFRDSEAYDVLRERVFIVLARQLSVNGKIRIWVPGCATGEEAYSLAMSFIEYMQSSPNSSLVQIFGTDISDEAINIARTGFYQESQMENISIERRLRFFNVVEGGYQIKKIVRELCIFARQDITSDPPFSEIDLISCRNVLIYFKPYLQKRILSFFHYSLKPTGFLVLGNSESLGDTSDLFEGFDTAAKIYTRRSVPSRVNLEFSSRYYPKGVELAQKQEFSTSLHRNNLQKWADQIVLNRFAPAGAIVNENLDVIQFRGDTSPYLRIPPGEPCYNLLKMIRPSLLIDLRMLIEEVRLHGTSIRRSHLEVPNLSNTADLNMEVIPFQTSTSTERFYLILFELETPKSLPYVSEEGTESDEALVILDPTIRQLEQKLAKTRQDLLDTQTLLQLTIEEKESTNQQLIAANEEILSSNEELKSTNEELQTAKEEIQSANEELITTNEELKRLNQEASQANDDLINLIDNVNIPILILSEDLRIRRFTPSAREMFKLISSDEGRPISDLQFSIINIDLEKMVKEVITILNPLEQEVQNQEGHWFMLRIRPYRTTDNRIEGAIIVLVDIHNLKQSEQNLRQVQTELETELTLIKQVQDLSMQLFSDKPLEQILQQVLISANALLHADMGTIQLYDPQKRALQIVAHQGFGPEFLDHFQEVGINEVGSACGRALTLGHRVIIEDVQTDPEFAPNRAIAASAGFRAVQSTPLMSRQGQLLGILSSNFRQPHRPSERELRMLDLYGRMVSEMIALTLAQNDRQALLEQARVAEAANASKDEFLAMLSHELRTPLTSISTWIQLLMQGQLNEAKMEQAIDYISLSTSTLEKLIDDLLDVSHIVSQRFSIEPEPCDLRELVQEAIDQMQNQLIVKNLKLEVDFQFTQQMLMLDPLRIRQVIANLLNNGIRYTPKGGKIIVRLIDMQTNVQIQVSDTGQGINPDVLPHIFERFWQADSSKTRRFGGLGLGLFLVKSLVEAHGGSVVANSLGANQGASFTITLPKVSIDPPQKSSVCRDTVNDLSGIQILLVEDDGITSLSFTVVLENCGAIVTTVQSATEALELLSQNLPNLLISDIGLPDINGYDLMRQIRALPPEQGGQLPAIALSGYTDNQSVKKSLEVGFQVHLKKPVVLQELINNIIKLINPLESQ